MSENSSNNLAAPLEFGRKPMNRWYKALGYAILIIGSFVVAQILVIGLLYITKYASPSIITSLKGPAFQTVLSVIVYALTIGVAFTVPWVLRRSKVTREDLGLTRLPEWKDILLAPAGFIIYIMIAGLLAYLATTLWPSFNAVQNQDVGFNTISVSYQYLLAFLTLVVIAPIAEEILMRGYLYGRLRRLIPVFAAVIITSIVFGVLHMQWNVGVNVFALSLVLCGLREVSGSIWAGILLHMMKNGLAFYLLFINPTILHTMGVI